VGELDEERCAPPMGKDKRVLFGMASNKYTNRPRGFICICNRVDFTQGITLVNRARSHLESQLRPHPGPIPAEDHECHASSSVSCLPLSPIHSSWSHQGVWRRRAGGWTLGAGPKAAHGFLLRLRLWRLTLSPLASNKCLTPIIDYQLTPLRLRAVGL